MEGSSGNKKNWEKQNGGFAGQPRMILELSCKSAILFLQFFLFRCCLHRASSVAGRDPLRQTYEMTVLRNATIENNQNFFFTQCHGRETVSPGRVTRQTFLLDGLG